MRTNLLAEISHQAGRQGAGNGVTVLGFGTADETISYADLLSRSACLSQRIPPARTRPVNLVIAPNSPLPTMIAFFAGLYAGARPLILPGPKALGGIGPFVERLESTLARFPGQAAIALEDGMIPEGTLLPDAPVIPLPLDIGEYGSVAASTVDAEAGDDDVAFLQMTSASTGDSKLVAVSHANACANLASMGAALELRPGDRMATWLPLHHDMGLVGTTLMSFFLGLPLVMMKPSEFIMRPRRWIEAIARYGCTITAGPNFGYDYTRRMVSDADLAGLDLSALRHAVIGAEPIRLATLQAFTERFQGNGFRAEAFTPSYGMAESTLCTTMVRGDIAPRYLLVDPAHTSVGSALRVLGSGHVGLDRITPQGSDGVAVFSVGQPVDGLDVHLQDDAGQAISGEHVLGEIVLQGASVVTGYLNPATGQPDSFRDGIHRTGDLGFVDGNDLFIMERRKNVIIRRGQNFLASLLEERAAQILDRSAHEIMVLDRDIHDPGCDITLIMENVSNADRELTRQQIADLRNLELPVDVLAVARKRVIPRTTSGKKRYEEARRLLSADDLMFDRISRLSEVAA